MNPTPKHLESLKTVASFGDPTSPVWIIGEAPGAEEILAGRPFVGRSGIKLASVLEQHGLKLDEYYLSNLCEYRPKNNDFKNLYHLDGIGKNKRLNLERELEIGLGRLYKSILTHKPKIILALGNAPLYWLTGYGKMKKEGVTGISTLRGSVYPFLHDPDIMILSTYHPSFILRDPTNFPAFHNDINKLARWLRNEYHPPIFNIDIDPSDEKVEEYCNAEYLGSDIESIKGSTQIICIGFAKDSRNAISIHLDGSIRSRQNVRRLLESSAKKIFHFGVFDVTMLELNSYEVTNYVEDSIIASHVLYPELPRDLGYLASIYTDINPYKMDGKAAIPDDEKSWNVSKRSLKDLMIYNGKDCCLTYDILFQMKAEMDKDDRRIYAYEIELNREMISVGHIGLLRDPMRLREMVDATNRKIERYEKALEIMLDSPINVKSPKQVKHVLYEVFGLPKKFAMVKRGEASKITSNNDALVSLLTYCKNTLEGYKDALYIADWTLKLKFIQSLLILRETYKLLSSQLMVSTGDDGRIRSLYKVPGTESGRLAASKFVDGTGMNIQTVARESVEI